MRVRIWVRRLFWLALAALAGPAPAFASCGVIAGLPATRQLAALETAAVEPDRVRLTFIGHASFLIETAGGATAITDYNGYNRPPSLVPDIVTMNNAHSTHYTDDIPPGVRHVLRGWNPAGGMAVHDVTWRDLRVFNVPTNVRQWGGDGTRQNGNSIFVFAAADLCIAHLSHIHHTLTETHLRELGPIDVLLAPVDGAWTMSQEDVLTVIGQIKPRLVVPMHYIVADVVQRFVAKAAPLYPARFQDQPAVLLSRRMLPRQTEILVLPGR
ncbi:Zn-dependent hydrolase [Allostella sp. ATCC 35155]|nr:Zn-dependent hydrolase [Stella sp. ATCC 35155]